MNRGRPALIPGVMVAAVFLMGGIPAHAQSPAAALFARGLSALHAFEYEDANATFRDAQRADPAFAMAWWGEAMTYDQTLWRKENLEAGRAALRRLPESTRARLRTTPLEEGYLDAAAVLFSTGDTVTRHRKYAEAMEHLYEAYPDDPDVAAFYALALLGTMSRSLIGYEDPHEGHVHGLAGSDVQTRVADILQNVLKSQPDHVGALHYLIHTYDDPEHARLGLDAARRLEKLALPSSHARHMPAHIFLQLGMWREATVADQAAFDASDAWIKRRNLPATLRSYHALSWLQYELLQRGRYADAAATIRELEPVVKASGEVSLLSDLSSMRARYVIESRRWDLMANERQFANVHDLFAVGVSAARTGNSALAETARHALAARAHAEREGDLRPAIAIMERELSALIDRAAGHDEQAIQTLRKAAEAELQLPAPLGLPEPIKPAPELLGEVLLDMGRPREAIEPFEQTLRRSPNRSLSVLGLARAAAALGDTDSARVRYRQLLENFDAADADRPELAEARRALETVAAPAAAPRSQLAIIVLAAFAAAGATFIVVGRRRKHRQQTVKTTKTRSRRSHRT